MNLYLVGLMGSGKTTVGRQLAKRLGRAFLDSDHEIEARTGVRIPTIFEIEGEAGFRRREAQVIEALTQQQGIVLATGGGAVLDAQNRQLLRQRGWTVYLDAQPALLWERTRYDRNRPLLQTENPRERLERLYAERDPLYRETAHFVADCNNTPFPLLVQSLLKEFSGICEHCT
ncbi:MAG: shikimate kinase [Zoogloeaceae bacterium]|jgi:shikimate kinase|nr:shikimate kinase [Zoogloeaceae bacterium]